MSNINQPTKITSFKNDTAGLIKCFTYFLAENNPENNCTFVMFECGTFVRCDNNDIPLFAGFETHDFPEYRVSSETHKEINKANKNNWEWAQTLPFKKEINEAYSILINSGYPYPGGDGADRYPLLCKTNKNIAMVKFPNLKYNDSIMTLSVANSNNNATIEQLEYFHYEKGAEARRYDYMIPQIAAVIECNGKIHLY